MNRIHLGYHKAGSTFLQALIFPHVLGYQGRFYKLNNKLEFVRDEKCFITSTGQGLSSPKHAMGACEKIINRYKHDEDVFLSSEIFSNISHDNLLSLLDPDKWNVLIIERKFEDILRSRRNHHSESFFLQEDINRNKNNKKIQEFYNGKKLSQKFKHSTVISFEKLFSGDPVEIQKLSNYLEFDISEIFLQNISKKINASRPGRRKG